jgi:hypothetical protein
LAIENELRTEGLIVSCLTAGQAAGVFRTVDPIMTASLIKPLLQDWYLKRWKYSRRHIGPDDYAEWVIGFVESFLEPSGQERAVAGLGPPAGSDRASSHAGDPGQG